MYVILRSILEASNSESEEVRRQIEKRPFRRKKKPDITE